MAKSVPIALALLLPAAALGAQQDEVPKLLHELVAGSVGESNHALSRLQVIGPAIVGPSLRQMLGSFSDDDRIAASGALIVIHDTGAGSALDHALDDSNWEVRRNAVNALVALNARRAAHHVVKLLRADKNERVRKACVAALTKFGGNATALAQAAVHDASQDVRLAALDGAAHSMDPAVAPTLWPLLANESNLVRFAAARTLAWGDDQSGRKFLTDAVYSRDGERVQHAVIALSDVPHGWAVGLLAQAMEGTDDEAACEAAAALAKRKDPRGREYLEKIATSHGPQSGTAQSWLEKIGEDQK